MPYKTDKLKIDNQFLDRRTKLIDCQKELIKYLFANSDISINGLARQFKVNKRLIQFILFTERQKKNLIDIKNRGWTMYYNDKDYHKKKMKEHRRYKHKIL